MRDSVVFYRSFAEAIECLPEDEQLTAFWNIINYALDGIEPDGSGAALAVFKMAKPQIDTNYKRYENGTKGGRPKQDENQTETKPKPNANQTETKAEPNVNVNENDNEKENTLKGVREKFKPPTVGEVQQYAAEKGYAIDAERFVDFYESKGWMVGKNHMKDWKSAVRNWARSDTGRKEQATKPKNQFNNFDQRTYDYDELERMLLNRNRGGAS